MSRKLLLYLAISLSVVLSLRICAYYFSYPKFLTKTDLVSFLTGSKIINEGRAKLLYKIDVQSETQNFIVYPEKKGLLPFRNFPITALFYTPFLRMSLLQSYLTVFAVNVFLLLIFQFFTLKSVSGLKKDKHLLLLMFSFYPTVSSLIIGQYTPLMLLIFLFIFIFSKNDMPFFTGLLSSCLLFKPQFVLFLPFALFLSKNKKKYLAGLIFGTLLFFGLNILITKNIRPFMEYRDFILATESPSYGSRPWKFNTAYGLLKRVFPNFDLIKLTLINAIFYSLFVYASLITFVKHRNFDLLYTQGVLVTILFSLHALDHDLVLLLLPIYLLIRNNYFHIPGLIFSTVLIITPLISAIFDAAWFTSVVLLMFVSYFLFPDFTADKIKKSYASLCHKYSRGNFIKLEKCVSISKNTKAPQKH